MKKILVVTDSINIEDSSGSKANVAIIKNLVATGFQVLVYHYTRKNIEIAGTTCFSIPEIRTSFLFFISRLQRYFTIYTKKNINPFIEGKLGFSLVFLNDSKSITKALKKCDFNPDLILTLSKGASFRPHHSLLKISKWHHKWLAYVHDPYPAHLYPRPYNWVETSYRQKEFFFRKVSEKARWSGFPSKLLQEWMGSYFPKFLENGVIIPHQNAAYQVQNKIFPEYFDSKKFNVLHAGNLMSHRPPKGLIEGFLLFLKRNPSAISDSKLLLIGPADHHDLLKKHEKNVNIYIQSKSVIFDTIYYLQTAASVNIILESKSEISPFLPAKFPHCVAANKPILSLSPFYSETRRLLGNDYEFWCEVDDTEKIARHIEKLYYIWQNNSTDFLLNRLDLEDYLSAQNLQKIISQI
jgi:hypothetical protein